MSELSATDAESSVRHWLARASARLGERREAELLLEHVLKRDRAWLFAHADAPLRTDEADAFAHLVERRAAGEPVAYLTGQRGFWTLDIAVTPATLIPRPETETLVEQALLRLPADGEYRLADLGTGSGAIALAVASERPQARIMATDVSADALGVARANAANLRLAHVTFAQGDWWAPLLGQQFDVIVSNPPYIEADDPHLAQGDLRFEPASALASGADGLDAIRVIVHGARDHLVAGGWLLFEHGWNQGARARALLQEAGYGEVFTALDLEGRDRVSGGRR